MMDSQLTILLRDVRANAVLLGDALRSLSQSNMVARRLLELLERDVARLTAAIESDTRQTILLALAFPSLDGRAADALGGFDMEANPATANQYRELNQSLVAAFEALKGG